MFTTREKDDANYLCHIVRIGLLRPVEDSDNLMKTIIKCSMVVVDKTVKEGDLMLYFPVGCKIQDWYLKKNNLYRSSKYNQDLTKKGFIDKNRKVRRISLRGQPSLGLVMPLSSLDNRCDWSIDKNLANISFDTFDGKLLVEKSKRLTLRS